MAKVPEELTLVEVTSVQEQLKKAYNQVALAEEAALYYGSQCNIMDALHQMTITHDRAKHLEDVARLIYGDGLISMDEYINVIFGVEKYLAFDLQEKVARQILDQCDCRRK